MACEMQGYNCIIIYNKEEDSLLFCRRLSEPYKGKLNLVGGKIEAHENGFDAAYRELEEETGIGRGDVELSHMMDFTYYNQNCYVEIYAGTLNKAVILKPEKHPLVWIGTEENFFDLKRFAGEGNIGHMLEQVKGFGMGERETKGNHMYYNNGLSALGMGGLRFPAVEGSEDIIDEKKAAEVIDAAMAGGINLFDTAYTYQDGNSEKFMGKALSKYPRDSYFLSTKFYVAVSYDIEEIFEEQLKRLQTHYFDYYFLHCLDEETFPHYTDKARDYIGFLLKQKEAGRIRKIGFSSHASPEMLEEFLEFYDGYDAAIIQLNYLDWTMMRGREQYEIVTAHNIPIWVMEPMKGGRLSTLNDKASKLLEEAAPGRSISSWGFRWLQSFKNIQTVLSGMSDLEQMQDNLKTFHKAEPLHEGEKEILERARRLFMESLGVACSSCRYCCSYCPEGLDIPLLIRSFNEKNVSGDVWRVAGLATAKGAEGCIGCGQCLTHCPQKIDIPAVMKKIANL